MNSGKKIKLVIKNLYLNIAVLGMVSLIGPSENNDDSKMFEIEKIPAPIQIECESIIESNNILIPQPQEAELIIAEDEKEYSGMALSNEYEDYLHDKCSEYQEKYELDISDEDLLKIMLTIGEQESHGSWDTNGVVSSTNDYGQFQINKCNHKDIYDELGYTQDELLNDEYKNADAAIWLMCENILTNKHCETIEDVFGMYNGWIGWENKRQSRNYSDSCIEILDNYFEDEGYVKEIKKN